MLNKLTGIKFVLLYAAFVAIAACGGNGDSDSGSSGGSGELKVDASSNRALGDSLKKVRASISEEQEEEFTEAMMYIGDAVIRELDPYGDSTDPDIGHKTEKIVREKINGKTVEQIIVMGKEFKAARDKM